MHHRVIYWAMAKRTVDIDHEALETLRRRERLGEVYIEFLDGVRRPLAWNDVDRMWMVAEPATFVDAA
jgi:hypothetical protein